MFLLYGELTVVVYRLTCVLVMFDVYFKMTNNVHAQTSKDCNGAVLCYMMYDVRLSCCGVVIDVYSR